LTAVVGTILGMPAALVLATGASGVDAQDAALRAAAKPDPLGRTTVQQRIVPGPGEGYRRLQTGPGEDYVVREENLGTAKPGRKARRRSLAYIGQLSDFQLADEESPSRVEQLDPIGPPVDAAWRPWEAMEPHIDDSMIRQVNAFAPRGPLREGDGSPVPMDFVIDTGDSADNQQLNETRWVQTLLDGGRLDPNSGISSQGYVGAGCPLVGGPGAAEAARYTGVQDYDDYDEGPFPYFYDPDDPRGTHAGFPAYPGLLDQAQKPFEAAGLDVPSYVAFGNHDALVQGNQAASGTFERVGTGCVKNFDAVGSPRPMAGPTTYAEAIRKTTPQRLEAGLKLATPISGLVPPDPARRFVSKEQYKRIFQDGEQADGHGFDYIDPAVRKASRGSAGYYSFKPVPHLRMIAVDTVSEGGVAGPSASGNFDDPQFRWLEDELRGATRRGERVILFSHHGIQSLTADVPDEAAPPCTRPDEHGHDVNPGCDIDPRSSTPIHLEEDLTDLLHRFPNVIAWIAGHSHVNDIRPYPDPNGKGGFWMIRTAAEADWPQQARLVQLFDNRDGTLSIFGTIIDHASRVSAPPSGTSAKGFGRSRLASVGRNIAYNDLQSGARECDIPCGEGLALDRNVELLLRDPLRGSGGSPSPGGGGSKDRRCGKRLTGTGGDDRLVGTKASERVVGRGGDDELQGKGSPDCIAGGPGADLVGGGRGGDRLRGGRGSDRLDGRAGRDRISGGLGRDRLNGGGASDRIDARDGFADRIDCGRGDDVAIVDRRDRVSGCERLRHRPRGT